MASELWESWPDVAGTALAGVMLSALVEMDAVDVMTSALEVPVVESVAGPHTLCPCQSRSELWMPPGPGVGAGCNATKNDVNSYEPKQVAAWNNSKPGFCQFRLLRSNRPGCILQFVIVYFGLFEALGVLKTSGPILLNITSPNLQDWGLDRSMEKALLEAV